MQNKNGFDLSHLNCGTSKCGQLVPVMCKLLPPNSDFTLGVNMTVELPPLVAPTMGRIDAISRDSLSLVVSSMVVGSSLSAITLRLLSPTWVILLPLLMSPVLKFLTSVFPLLSRSMFLLILFISPMTT